VQYDDKQWRPLGNHDDRGMKAKEWCLVKKVEDMLWRVWVMDTQWRENYKNKLRAFEIFVKFNPRQKPKL